MKDEFTIMLPVSRTNLGLANRCISHLLNNCDLNIIVIDEHGNDDDYIKSDRVSFIHNSFTSRPPLVKIWNQCIKECPTEYVILASWRQRPTPDHFKIIDEKLKEGYGCVFFDDLHFFSFSKHLTTIIGFFDEGFTMGQFEDTDWYNRLKTSDIGVFCGDISEETGILSTWLGDLGVANRRYYDSKWTEDKSSGSLILKRNEVNYNDRKLYMNVYENRTYKKWNESVLKNNLITYYSIFNKYKKVF
jgi:hypothetical protein